MRINTTLLVLAYSLATAAMAYAQVGACCLPDGGCIQTIAGDCLTQGGAWVFAAPCLGVCGTCCLPAVGCIQTSDPACQDEGGTFAFLPCEAFCPGACCLPSGACVMAPANPCQDAGGVFQGASVVCEPGMCSPPLVSAFTYQGQLLLDGTPVDGLADLEFRLCDVPVGGSVLDEFATQAIVQDGLFTVEVEMAAEAFNGDERWLEIDVRVPAGSGEYQTLSPRVRVSPTPYALQVRGMHVDESFNVGIGTVDPADTLTVVGDIGVDGTAASNAGAVRTFGPDSLNTMASWISGQPDHGFFGVYDAAGDVRASMSVASPNVGRVLTRGPSGVNIDLAWLTDHPDHGLIGVRNAAGQNRATIYVDENAAGQVLLKDEAGTNTMRLRGSGNTYFNGGKVGIGESNPATLLHVKGEGDIFGNHVALFVNTSTDGTGDGIAIKLWDESTSKENNFITFLDGQNRINGRIEGFNFDAGDWQPPPVTFDVNLDIDFSPGSLPTADFDPGSLPTFDASPPFSFDFSPGSLPTLAFSGGSLPSVSAETFTFDLPTQQQIGQMYAWAHINGIDGFLTLDPVSLAATSLKVAAIQTVRNGGVTYGSKGADYAEWLPKLDPDADFQFGQVIGIHGGKISLETDGADSIMAVSHAPIVLGNFPPEGLEDKYEKVAFMGQTKVVVRGRVSPGDYVVPSGLNDGTAVAVTPANLTADHLDQILGRAWSASANDIYSLINVSVGLDHHGAAIVLRNQQAALDARAHENAALRAELEDLRASIDAVNQTLNRDRQ